MIKRFWRSSTLILGMFIAQAQFNLYTEIERQTCMYVDNNTVLTARDD